MTAAGERLVEALRRDGLVDRDLKTYSAPGWTAYAGHAEDLQAAIKALAPPAAVTGWHAARIELLGLSSAIARSAASTGLLATGLAFSDRIDEVSAREDAALADAKAACPGFAAWHERWDVLDGERDEPAASPTAGATPVAWVGDGTSGPRCRDAGRQGEMRRRSVPALAVVPVLGGDPAGVLAQEAMPEGWSARASPNLASSTR